MNVKTAETIIIGGGISGLACARQLQTQNQDFLLISKDIGGRILTSEAGTVNYGAFFTCSDYYNFLKYAKIQSRIRLRDFCFHEIDDKFVLFEPQLLLYLNQFLKIRNLLNRFRRSLRFLRKTAETQSQKVLIEADSFLYELYKKEAIDLIKEFNLYQVTEKYLSKALYSTTFSSISEINAFSFLQFLLPLITPIYTFIFEKDKMIESFQENIFLEKVLDIQRKNNYYKIKTNGKTYHAKNLVLATEISWSQQFAGVKKINKPIDTNMLHIQGTPKKCISKKKYQLYSNHCTVQAIASLPDGTFLLYYKNEQPPLDSFFTKHQVMAHHLWNPAGRINGHFLIECDRGNNMYLIGDYNIAGLEEAFITGIFAANQIVQSH
jgi:putative NAD(P)-binding protein